MPASTGCTMSRFFRAALAAVFAMLTPGAALAKTQDQITVLAAASLTNVLPEVGTSYEAANHVHVVFSFAASMTLARQIEASSGADMFISADKDSMNYLAMRGLIDQATRRDLLTNGLVL